VLGEPAAPAIVPPSVSNRRNQARAQRNSPPARNAAMIQTSRRLTLTPAPPPYDAGVRRTTLVGLALLALGACGSDDSPDTPAACLAPASDYLSALETAPAEVRLSGSTPISGCLVAEQDPGALANVGRSLVDVATTLNAEARADPDGGAAVQLGYLSGAVDQAAETTGGIHQDLRLRLATAARFTPGGGALSASFERGFAEGYAAGRADD
jgi:hypothetical protein